MAVVVDENSVPDKARLIRKKIIVGNSDFSALWSTNQREI
jgi:hypothetical protein